MSEIKLRPWQSEAIKQGLDWLTKKKTHRHFLINAAPGSGKTICASVLAKELIEAKEIDRVIVIAPRREVVRQWADEFDHVTGRHMSRVTGADVEIEEYGVDLCATWTAVQGLLDGFQQVCKTSKTLVICDEHHHAAVEAAWGTGADGAFAAAKYVLILTGTPIRSDGKETIWFAYDSEGKIDHPREGTYTLTYGKSVDLEYCRPITFHRHEGKFSVVLGDGTTVKVSGKTGPKLEGKLKDIKALKRALDFYRLACTPHYKSDGTTPETNCYQASMLDWGIEKLDDIRQRIPDAGGLVIAPNIDVAIFMAALLEKLDGEKPFIVHSQQANPDKKIAAFRNSKKRWIVSVAMVSEGVDIKRLRILVYLPYARTELAFRQAMGRVVRTLGPEDDSRAYVIMPIHKILEEYARRVEKEMSPPKRKDETKIKFKICPICEEENSVDADVCKFCEFKFPARRQNFKNCDNCDALNPINSKTCQACGHSFENDYSIKLEDALRMGAIVRGLDLSEDEVVEGESLRDEFREEILRDGDEALLKLIRVLPEEAYGRLKKMLNK